MGVFLGQGGRADSFNTNPDSTGDIKYSRGRMRAYMRHLSADARQKAIDHIARSRDAAYMSWAL